MRIGVNAVPLRTHGGGARYVFAELIDRLLAIDTQNRYVLFAHPLAMDVIRGLRALRPGPAAGASAEAGPHADSRSPADSRTTIGSQNGASRLRVIEVACEEEIFDHADAFDLYFGPLNNLQPRIYDRPSVAILHDIQEHFFPQYFSPGDLAARREIYPEICRSATTLVTISEFCRQTMIERFGLDPSRVEVVYNAPQSGLSAAHAEPSAIGAAPAEAWARDPLPQRFFFYPANCYPHKNHALLLDVLEAMVRSAGSASVPPPAVVFTGFEVEGGFPLREEIRRRGLDAHTRVYEDLAVDELRTLYRRAVALVMPTRFEGFGMPAVEALAMGCPIICSDLPPLREICGTAALYVPLDDATALAGAMQRLLGEPALRGDLTAGGLAQAPRFSWDVSARRFIEIFDAAAARFRPAPAADRTAAPRIGILVNGTLTPDAIEPAIRSILDNHDPGVVIQILLTKNQQPPRLPASFPALRVVTVAERGPAAWSLVERFAADERLDLVGELIAGRSRLTPTALHSLADAAGRDGESPILFGEAWQHEGAEPVRSVARLRELGDGRWLLHGFVHPEMLFIRPRQLAAWSEGAALLGRSAADWRIELVRLARSSSRLCLVRRTLAVCDISGISMAERAAAVAGGVEVVHLSDGRPVGGWLRRLKPLLKPASRMLPGAWRVQGERWWRRLTRA
ncbi:MAG: glycosyltransferase family 4 protein [Phycisphaerales bacterium]|nr:glycosyltransferase family 4 protein [Phycisphaerales bacterium]